MKKLARLLPERGSENDLMRRCGVTRLQLRRVLTRIAGEGWIERNEGRGWTFAALIDSLEAYRESYELRQILEPQGLRSDGFVLDALEAGDRMHAADLQEAHIGGAKVLKATAGIF